jgi:hypothetical protein
MFMATAKNLNKELREEDVFVHLAGQTRKRRVRQADRSDSEPLGNRYYTLDNHKRSTTGRIQVTSRRRCGNVRNPLYC